MLPLADAAIVGRDSALPGLALVLDAEALAARLGTGPLRPLYLRYKPGTSAVAGFAGPGGPLDLFAAIAYPAERYAEVRGTPRWREGYPPGRYLDDAQLAIVPLAHDRGLKAPRRLVHSDRRERFLSQVLGEDAPLSRADLAPLRYKPGRRLVAALTLDGEPRAVLKAYAAADFPRAVAGARHGADAGGVPILGVSTARHVLIFGWIAGQRLGFAGGAPNLSAIDETGRRIARLHARAARAPFKGDVEALVRIIDDLSQLAPDLGHCARPLAETLCQALAAAGERSAPIHGDFSADQVLMRDGDAVVLDWDRIATGDPGADLGSFLARLDADVIDGTVSFDAAARAGAALLDGYARAAPVPGSAPLHHARGLLHLATEGFRQRDRDWPARTRRLIDRAGEVLAGAPIAGLPQLGRALDACAMAPLLADALGTAEVALNPPRLLRIRRGRRALVAYSGRTGAGTFDLLGKIRARGPDAKTPALQNALRLRGLDGSAGVGVPAVRGRIDALNLWLQERVPGRVGTDLMRDGAPTDVAARIGDALARLHLTRVETARRWSLHDEAAVLDTALSAASEKMPDEAPRLAAIAKAARDLLDDLPQARETGIHRDFYSDQVLVEDARVWIVDLDLYAWGDPAIDLGNFTAHLAELALRSRSAPEALEAHEAAFISAYTLRAPGVDPGRIAVMKAVSLARHIDISTRHTNRAHTTRLLIELSLAALTRRAHTTCAAS